MAQADQVVQDALFPAVRVDINSNLAALFSNSSGAIAPSTTVAYMNWIDTSPTNPLWKQRNSANNAWITLATLTNSTVAFEGTLPSQTGNAGKFLITNGTVASFAGSIGATVQTFTTSVTYQPTSSKVSFLVFCTGGGGGSGSAAVTSTTGLSASGGGGGGGTAIRLYTSSEMSTFGTVVIGAGGGASSVGGNSSFTPGGTGLAITGVGGSPSSNVSGAGAFDIGGLGGGTTNSVLDCRGARGGTSGASTGLGAVFVASGSGGSAFWAGGRGAGASGVTRSGNGTTAGGAGTGGVVFILEW